MYKWHLYDGVFGFFFVSFRWDEKETFGRHITGHSWDWVYKYH